MSFFQDDEILPYDDTILNPSPAQDIIRMATSPCGKHYLIRSMKLPHLWYFLYRDSPLSLHYNKEIVFK